MWLNQPVVLAESDMFCYPCGVYMNNWNVQTSCLPQVDALEFSQK